MSHKTSIVIPSYNQGQYIEQTITSILDQNYKNIELIIIDGGSTDNTVDIIKKYESSIAYWVSEPDNGQAHAINKGLQKTTGEIFNWINSDDYLEPGALKTIVECFNENKEAYICCGFTKCFYDEDGSTSHEYKMGLRKTVAETITHVEMNQPGTFYRTSVVKELGGVNDTLHYVFDDELWFKYLCRYGLANVIFTDARIADFRLHKNSKSVADGSEVFNKELQSVYISLAEILNAPHWLVQKMKTRAYADNYNTGANWITEKLNREQYLGYFASKYINSLYRDGQKHFARKAMNMAVKNGFFKWNRMMMSLRLKLLFS